MTLIVEDGTGIARADCYVTGELVSAYALARGLIFLDDESGSAAILRATTWLDGVYQSRYPGIRTHGRKQGLQWPRKGAVDAGGVRIDSDEIPSEIITASCAAAIHEFAVPGALSPVVTPGKAITAAAVAGAVSVQYKGGNGVEAQRQVLTAIEDILASLIGKKQNSAVAIAGEAGRA